MTRSGINRLVETIERTRLAWPMALLMAAAAAFLAYAVPTTIVERAVAGVAPLAAVAVPFGAAARGVLAVAVALLSGGAVWLLFDRLEGGRAAALDEDPDIDLFAPEADAAPAPAPQLRRADAHPDAPARRPIFAASDLGVPMDDVDTGQTPFGRAPLFAEAPATAPMGWDEADLLVLDERYAEDAVPAPMIAPVATLRPVAAGDESISGLMARLERGLERRGGPAAVTPDDPDGGLRTALEELRRMTTGR